MKILKLDELNRNTAEAPESFIEAAEAQYREGIEEVAKKLVTSDNAHPIILISGPSGSGKTTTALRLATMLENMGRIVHPIS
ncbi:MAG: nucleoside kinase, partial [Ruminiclostridium sp.]